MVYYFLIDVKTERKETWVVTPDGRRRKEVRLFVVYGILLINPDGSPITHDDFRKAEFLASRLSLKTGKDVWIVDKKGMVVGVVRYKELTKAPVYRVIIPFDLRRFPTMVVE